MKFIYQCRHCQMIIDVIEGGPDLEQQLGLTELSLEEQNDTLVFDEHGQNVHVKTVCDYCYQAILANPELVLIGNPLQ